MLRFVRSLAIISLFTFAASPAVGAPSVARQWNEAMIQAIRKDLARPTVQARNLFHFAMAVYDSWAVYDSVAYQGSSGWMVFGGTSAAAPIVAAASALAGHGVGPSNLYPHASSLFDVTSGSNGRCKRTAVLCTAGTGWDGPTGLGTPNGLGAF